LQKSQPQQNRPFVLCVALGDIDGKPFSVAKIAAYMRVPSMTSNECRRRTKEALTLAAQTQDEWEQELFERRRYRN
jgi:hypothetical protein